MICLPGIYFNWRPFQVPLEPALHSDPKKYGYILYQGIDCVKQGWGHSCHDEVQPSLHFFTGLVYICYSLDFLYQRSIYRRCATPS